MNETSIQTPLTSSPSAPDTAAQRAGDRYVNREIPLELIDEPEIPERETMDEEALADLALRIQDIGLINPISVHQVGSRYRTIAGHRRLLACRLVKYSPVPCRVYVGADVDPVAILVGENADREAVGPVEEARFYARLMEKRCGNDVDQVCALVRRNRNHVEGRLLMLQIHPKLLEAIERKQVRLAVASELAKIPDVNRMLMLLDVAINSGATARQVAEWRKQAEQLGPVQVDPADQLVDVARGAAAPTSNPMTCFLCDSAEHNYMMELIWLHKPCKGILERMLQRTPHPTSGIEE